MSTPAEQITQLKATQKTQQDEIDILATAIGTKLSTSDFEKQLKAAQDKEEKEKNGKVFDDPDWYSPTAGSGQKSEWNIAKEEINGLNTAVNVIAASLIAVEFSWSLFKIEFKPLFTPRWVDRVNEAIGKLQDRRGWNNPEGDAERRLVRIETGTGRLQDMAYDARRRIDNTNKRVGYLEKTVAQLKRRSNTSRQAIRHMDASPALAGTTDRLVILETRVRLLSEALG